MPRTKKKPKHQQNGAFHQQVLWGSYFLYTLKQTDLCSGHFCNGRVVGLPVTWVLASTFPVSAFYKRGCQEKYLPYDWKL
jgi:hypothetical protein